MERDIRRAPLGLLAAWTDALDGYLSVEVQASGERPLRDARHAELQNRVARSLRSDGWIVDTERSFNHFGDRGRIDILAYHLARRILLVVEIKSRLHDVQDTLGRLDVKLRVAPRLAADRAWAPFVVVPALIIREDRTSRRRVHAHDALFATFDRRARAARSWLRTPRGTAPTGILLFEPDVPPANR
jgi:Holliday junction resolvase-like predicted endonuclease